MATESTDPETLTRPEFDVIASHVSFFERLAGYAYQVHHGENFEDVVTAASTYLTT